MCWQTVEQQFNPALAIASAVGTNFKTRHRMTEQEILKAISKVKGIGGMTVNERLCVCGLMDEFEKSLISDKDKAKKILQLLRVDNISIDKIVT